jgi:hypothetical protein
MTMKPWTKAAVQGAACGLMLGMALLIGGRLRQPPVAAAQAKQSAVADVVMARGFAVVDAAGIPRITMGVTPDGNAGFTITDPNGRRISMGVSPDGPAGLSIKDPNGRVLVFLAGSISGDGELMLREASERHSVKLATMGPSGAMVAIGDSVSRIGLSVMPKAGAGLLIDEAGITRAHLFVTPGGIPCFGLEGPSGIRDRKCVP